MEEFLNQGDPLPVTKEALSEIFQKQRDLIREYQKIEGLPSYPVDLSYKANQKLIRSFSDRIVEELAEAYLVHLQIFRSMSENDYHGIFEMVCKYNEELADALHFFVELLIYIGLDEGQITWFTNSLKRSEGPYEAFVVLDDPLKSLFQIGAAKNSIEDIKVAGRMRKSSLFVAMEQNELLLQNPQLNGGRRVNYELLQQSAVMLWNITMILKKACNKLKLKDWSQESEHIGNTINLKEDVLEAFLVFFQYMDCVENTISGLYYSYCKKNEINKKRIKNGY